MKCVKRTEPVNLLGSLKLQTEEWSDRTVVGDDCEILGLLPKLESEEQSDGVCLQEN